MLIKDVRPHEKLYIYRLRTGKSQSALALEHGVDYTLYRRIEKGRTRDSAGLFDICRDVEPVPREQAVLLRRRHGMTQAALAHEIGITRGWLVQQEAGHGNSDTLVSYWKEKIA